MAFTALALRSSMITAAQSIDAPPHSSFSFLSSLILSSVSSPPPPSPPPPCPPFSSSSLHLSPPCPPLSLPSPPLRHCPPNHTPRASITTGTVALGLTLFGPKSASFALNSFSPKDPLGVIARFAFGTSVLASFPLIFLSMRNWFVNQAVQKIPKLGGIKRISTLLLMLIALLASRLNDIGVVGSVAGGILGSSMMFVFPPIMYIRALQKKAITDGEPAPRFVILLNSVLMVCGGLLGLIGTTASLLALKK